MRGRPWGARFFTSEHVRTYAGSMMIAKSLIGAAVFVITVDGGEVLDALASPPSASPQVGAGSVPEPAADPVLASLALVDGGLTADEVAARAVSEGPSVEEARAQLEAAAAQLDQVRRSFTPALGLEASVARLSPVENGIPLDGATMGALDDFSFDVPLEQYALKATLGVPVSDWVLRLLPGLKAGKAGKRSAAHRETAARRVVATDGKVAYYGWLRARAQVAVAEASLVRSRARLKDAEVGVKAGMMSPSDVLRVDALVARTEAALEGARAVERVARRSLAILMNVDLDTTFEVGEAVMTDPTDGAETQDLETMVANGLAQRPELLAVDAAIDEVQASTRAQRAAYYPRLAAFGEALYANPNTRFFPLTDEWNGSWAVGGSISWSLDVAVVNASRVRALKAQRARVDAQQEQLRRAVTAEVVRAYEELTRTLASLDANERGRVSAAEGYRVVSVRFSNGTATTTDVINAEFDQVNATLALVNNHLDLLEARARLAFAAGAPIEGADGGN